MSNRKLTEQEFWENYWKTRNYDTNKVIEIKRLHKGSSINAILDIFDKYLPVNENFHILEIGGAPGQYLIYMAKHFKYHVNSLDYSRIGNEYTKKNMAAAEIPVQVYEKDLFSESFSDELPRFDIVYSLGFIEHFENLNLIVKKHTELLKPGGILLLGVPNLGGIYRFFLKRMAPQLLAIHNLNSMKIENWKSFEKELDLTVVFRGYVSGFEPKIVNKLEKKDLTARILNFIVKKLILRFSSKFDFSRLNSRYWSGYIIGIYKKNK